MEERRQKEMKRRSRREGLKRRGVCVCLGGLSLLAPLALKDLEISLNSSTRQITTPNPPSKHRHWAHWR